MRIVVTGAAGFIGSHLSERLLAEGHDVVGIDALTPYYDSRIKNSNVDAILSRSGQPRFTLHKVDLCEADLTPLVRGAEIVYHLAGQPGVDSFGPRFSDYVRHNLTATHRLLEAAGGVKLVVLASSSSVYGSAPSPFREDGPVQPTTPYGITKLAAEQLCLQYSANGMVPAMAFRFFTVYGPRQRPDMAFTKLCRAVLRDEPFPVRGTGEQVRDFTYVGDIVDALVAAAGKGKPGMLLNLGGGTSVSLNRAIAIVEQLAGRTVKIDRQPAKPGEMDRNPADPTRLRETLGFAPKTPIEEGLRRQFEWVNEHLALLS